MDEQKTNQERTGPICNGCQGTINQGDAVIIFHKKCLTPMKLMKAMKGAQE